MSSIICQQNNVANHEMKSFTACSKYSLCPLATLEYSVYLKAYVKKYFFDVVKISLFKNYSFVVGSAVVRRHLTVSSNIVWIESKNVRFCCVESYAHFCFTDLNTKRIV